MEPLIYTNADREDQGVLNDAYFDLEYGRDDDSQANTFELSIDRNSNTRLEDKALVYIEGTEYGGMVKGIGTNTAEDVITYKGMTWHGLLNCHVLAPNSGQDYLVLQGDAHTVLRSLIERMQLQEIFTAPMSLSGITVNHKARYEYGYYTMAKMLAESSAKLKMSYENGMVVLSAEPISDYSQQDELDTTQVALEIEQDYLPVNHLVCLGEGELKNRTVVHLYANKNGAISTTQSLFGDDENALIYDYSNADREELDEKGREKLKELQNCNTVKVDIPEGRVLDIGDLVGAIDPITGIYVATDVTYKTVVIDSSGIASVAYKVGDTSASKSMSGRSESSGGGISYSEGKGITIDGRTINADVDSEDLDAVNDLAQEAKTQASNAASAAAGAQGAASAAQQTADAAVATINAISPITAQRDDKAVSLSHANSGVSAGAYGATDNTTADWGDTVTVGARMSINGTGHVTNAQGRTVTLPGNTATQDTKGLMSANDKTKLDGIAQGANKTVVDTALSSTSTNPVQNKAVKAALDGKSDSDHTHNYAGSSSPGGAATSANKLATARTITLAGAVNGSATFDGSKNITITTIGDSEAAGFLAAHPPGTPYENENYIDMEDTYGGTWRYCPGFEFHRWVREE